MIRSFTLAILLLIMASSASAKPFRVLLDWFINPDHGALILAQARGYYTEAGLDVKLIEPADPNDPPLLLAAKKGDVAISYQPQLYLMRKEHLPVRAVGVLVNQPLNSLVVLDEGGAQNIQGLKGKTIGYSVGGFETAILGKMLESVKLSLEDVELVNINFALTSSLVSGQVDAVIGAFRNFELNQLSLANSKGRVFLPEDYGVPFYDELIVLAHDEQLERADIKAFLLATQRAAKAIIADPQGSWQEVITYRPSLDDDLNRLAWQDTAPLLAGDIFNLSQKRYQAFGEFARTRGLIEEVLPIEGYIAK